MDRLFKYISGMDAVVNICSGFLKFSPTNDLNDPTELLPELNTAAVLTSRKRLIEYGYSEMEFDWLRRQGLFLRRVAPESQAIEVPVNPETAREILKSSFYDDLDVLEKLHRATVRRIKDRVGVLSISESSDSFPMWAHYGDRGRGFCIRFRELDLEFAGDETSVLNLLNPVKYSTTVHGMTFDPESHKNIFFQKTLDWGYEREWRIVTPLAECVKHGRLHVLQIDKSVVDLVVCGWLVSDDEIKKLCEKFEKVNADVAICRMRVVSGRISFDGIERNTC